MCCLMNCRNCDHMKNNPDDGYCYMFRNEPKGSCAQFKSAAIPELTNREILKMFSIVDSI